MYIYDVTTWNGLQRFDSDAMGTLGMAEFLDRVRGDIRTEEKISRFAMLIGDKMELSIS